MTDDLLQLEVDGIETLVLTGIYSEETRRPQPLRVSVLVDLALPPEKFTPASPLAWSKDYLDLDRAVTEALPAGVHFNLVESVAEHICDHLFAQDDRISRVEVRIIKLAISRLGKSIGIRLVRTRI